mmetsp:Transcript_8926/g.24873  ORF Transcript_8926/g.24873 Transcript_8926/m.24873 type:complete len:161 (-) Transcript_8926:201-683(-)
MMRVSLLHFLLITAVTAQSNTTEQVKAVEMSASDIDKAMDELVNKLHNFKPTESHLKIQEEVTDKITSLLTQAEKDEEESSTSRRVAAQMRVEFLRVVSELAETGQNPSQEEVRMLQRVMEEATTLEQRAATAQARVTAQRRAAKEAMDLLGTTAEFGVH